MGTTGWELVTNATDLLARSSVASRAGMQFGTNRDTYSILGYPRTLQFRDYYAQYLRGDIAQRIISLPAEDTWRKPPSIVVGDDVTTELSEQWNDLVTRLKLMHYFTRADIISGIGEYSVLLIGVKGAGRLDQEITRTDINQDEIIYVMPYMQPNAEIYEYDDNPNSPRFGLPKTYSIALGNFGDHTKTSTRTVKVDWTRVIHIAEGLLDNDVYGRPRLERVWNRLQDLIKVAGGSAEMFWQNVATIWWLNVDPEAEFEDSELDALEAKMMEVLHGIRRLVQTEGGTDLKALSGQTPDPRGAYMVLQELIAAASSIPRRILFGNESGQLASDQDQAEWYGRVSYRQTNFAEPTILRAFISRMARFGVFTVPDSYVIEWPPLYEPSPAERAAAARDMANVAAKVAKDNPTEVISVGEIRTAVGLPKKYPDDEEPLDQPGQGGGFGEPFDGNNDGDGDIALIG